MSCENSRPSTALFRINDPDDGKVSLLEALLIASGKLGRAIQEHSPCELLPQSDPSWCPRKVREIDFISGPPGGGGALAADVIFISSTFGTGSIAVTSTLPSPGPGDELTGNLAIFLDGQGMPAGSVFFNLVDTFGITLERMTLKNSQGDGIRIQGGGQHQISLTIESAVGSGIVLDGGSGNNLLSGLAITNSGKHGVHLTGGTSNNTLQSVRVTSSRGSGILLEGIASDNRLIGVTSTNNGLHGLHLSGAGVRDNRVHGVAAAETLIRGVDLYENCGGYGILIDQGANQNTVSALSVKGNRKGGIALTDPGTIQNFIGFLFSRGFPNTPHIRIYDNVGPGIYLGPGARFNVVNHVSVAGNLGDGVLLEGPNCAFNRIETVWTGFDFFAQGGPVPKTNAGNGLRLRAGASDNEIGSQRYPTTYSHRSIFANNALSGILIEGTGTERNKIFRADFGHTLPSSYYSANKGLFKGNGRDGITLREGARFTKIGDENIYFDMHFFGSGEAGVRMSGGGSKDNVVLNCHFGYSHGPVTLQPQDKNRFGIVLENGTSGNSIGERGDRKSFSEYPFTIEYGNTIANSLEAGIVLNGAGATAPAQANLIQNNTIGVFNFAGTTSGNPVGILITGNSHGNVIGGTFSSTGNLIEANEKAGIHIHDNALDRPGGSNLIAGNTIANNGVTVVNPAPIDVLARPPHGVGVLVSGASRWNRIGQAIDIPNEIRANVVGIYLDGDGVEDTRIRGNLIGRIGVAQPGGGVVVRGGKRALIGSEVAKEDNGIEGNGAPNSPWSGGILLTGGRDHVVRNNRLNRNAGHGLVLHGTQGCTVGGKNFFDANLVTANGGNGLLLDGGATGTVVSHNFIGTDRAAGKFGNQGHGIAIVAGSDGNTIGSALTRLGNASAALEFGNTIAFNAMDGVFVSGSRGNSLLHNSIYGNQQKGINLAPDGNDDLQPPPLSFVDRSISGRVADLSKTPAGSRVQVFSDLAGEGEVWVGETDVKPGGEWILNDPGPLPLGMITATITHPGTLSTSPFGSGFQLVSGFKLRRDGNAAPTTRLLPSNVSRAVVHRLVAEAGDFPVVLRSLKISTTGTLPEDLAVTSVFAVLDANGNGEFDSSDREISARARFAADGSDLVMETWPWVVPENSFRKILVVYEFAQPTRAAVSFDLALGSAQAVVAETLFPVKNPVTPLGQFPILSDRFEFSSSAGPGFAAWRALHFTEAELANPAISGPAADPDGDRLINVVEYALGLNPRVADSVGSPRIYRNTAGKLVYEYQRLRSAPDLVFEVRFSGDLAAWFTDNRLMEKIDNATLPDGVDRFQTILSELGDRAFLQLEIRLQESE